MTIAAPAGVHACDWAMQFARMRNANGSGTAAAPTKPLMIASMPARGKRMNLHPIRMKRAYKAARKRLSAYFNNEPMPGTEGGDHFEILLVLVEAYEAKHVSIDTPDSIEAMRLRREQGVHTAQNLAGATRLQRFNAILDAPLENNAAIRRLLNTPAPWEW